MSTKEVRIQPRFFRLSMILCLALCLAGVKSSLSLAQVSTAITSTTGSGDLGTTITQSGNLYDITGGTRPGNGTNLFHSFGEFGVPTNNIANFLNETALPTSNILGRVTGGNISNIFGTIQTTGFENANLFLMNPAGFLFGPNATVNVGGMVSFTSADYLKLADNARFNAIPNAAADALLTASPVATFGFLGSNPGAITFKGSQFTVTEGTGISLVGGNIAIEAGTLADGTVQSARLSAPGGRIHLASAASPGEFFAGTVDQAPNGQSFGALGTIQVSQQSVIDASGDGGGTILIRGGRFVLDDSMISANTTGLAVGSLNGEPGKGIDIQVSQDVVIQNAAVLETNVSGNATPGIQYGGVHVQADRIEILGALDLSDPFSFPPFTGIRSDVLPGSTGGNSGDVKLEANSILVKDFAHVETLTEGAGDAGNIILRTNENLVIDNIGFIESVSLFASGNAGNIELASTHGNILMRTPFVTSQTIESSGNAGNISVTAPEGDVLLADQGSLFNAVRGTGALGGIQITANNLQVINESAIQGDNLTTQVPGNITVTLSGSLSLSGNSSIQTIARGPAPAADLNVTAMDIVITDGASLSTETFSSGPGGKLNISTNNLQLTNGGQIRSGSTIAPPEQGGPLPEIPSGSGGIITVQGLASPAESVLIDGAGSGLFTDTQGAGTGGNIFVDADSVTLQNGGMLSAETSGTNNGGDIQVDATAINLLTFASINTMSVLSDGSSGNIALKATQQITAVDSFLNTDAVGGTGLGGNILLSAPTIGVNGGVLSTSTSGTGRAGNILLAGQQISLGASPLGGAQGADLSASTNFGSGHGGTIILRGLEGQADDVTISGNSSLQTLTGAGGSGSAGDITINTARFTLTDRAQLNADTFGSGGSGTITITATDHAAVSGLSTTVSSSSDFGATGNAGQISVSAPTVMIENGGSISTNTTGEGTGGNINILASQSVTMTNDSSISARSTGPGNAGNILINAGQNYTSTDSAVTTQATAPGTEASGGNITVLATDMVQLTNSQLNASVQGSSTTVGGNITIDPQYVILQQNSQILANATQGQGGNISITTGLLLADATSVIDASSESGLHGTVTIQSPNAPASGKIQPLGKTPLQATSLLNQPCASLAGGEFSSFTVAGRDSLPTEPGSWLASPLAKLSADTGLAARGAGREGMTLGASPAGETPLLSLRQIAPAGFLTQAFAVDSSGSCTS